jgi:hypothetical protein
MTPEEQLRDLSAKAGVTPAERLAFVLDAARGDQFSTIEDSKKRPLAVFDPHRYAAAILAADPTIAADMELGRRIRDPNDDLEGFLDMTLRDLRAALDAER